MEDMLSEVDRLRLEKQEYATLLEQGVRVSIPKRLTKGLGRAERAFIIQQPYLHTLDCLSREYLDLNFSEEALSEEGLMEAKRVTAKNAHRCARIVAIAMLDNPLLIRLFTGLLAWYLSWHLTPAKLLQITLVIQNLANLPDFIGAIRLMSIAQRTAAPDRIANPQEPAAPQA